MNNVNGDQFLAGSNSKQETSKSGEYEPTWRGQCLGISAWVLVFQISPLLA